MKDALMRNIFACLLIFAWHSVDCHAQANIEEIHLNAASLGAPPVEPYTSTGASLTTGVQNSAALQTKTAAEVNGYTVSPATRSSVVAFYENVYVPVFSVPIDWTGNAQSCDAGTTSQAYIDASFDLINYYRAMVELPPVVNDVSKNVASQEAALIMSVNNDLSHAPPANWTCYTADGANAAGSSNIALGASGPRAIALYIKDPGIYNKDIGHRRWILHPPRASFGIGSVGDRTKHANALWVFAGTTSRPSTDIIAWPPRGFVPISLVYPRWSFSLNSAPTADYSSATVSMYENGEPVNLNIISNNRSRYGDITLVWEPSGLVFSYGQADREIEIVISNVGNAGESTFSYTVTVIDPAMDPPGIFTNSFE